MVGKNILPLSYTPRTPLFLFNWSWQCEGVASERIKFPHHRIDQAESTSLGRLSSAMVWMEDENDPWPDSMRVKTVPKLLYRVRALCDA